MQWWTWKDPITAFRGKLGLWSLRGWVPCEEEAPTRCLMGDCPAVYCSYQLFCSWPSLVASGQKSVQWHNLPNRLS